MTATSHANDKVTYASPMTPVEKRVLQHLVDRRGLAVSGVEVGVAAYDLEESYDPIAEKKYAAVVIYGIRRKLATRRSVILRIYSFGYMYLDNTIL